MSGINKVILVGNVGQDPEIKVFDNGGMIGKFSIATSESWKDKAGDWQEKTQWHNIVVKPEHLVKKAKARIQKGTLVYIEGRIETREYDKDGEKRYITEIVVPPYNGQLDVMARGIESDGGGYDNGGSSQSADDDIPF